MNGQLARTLLERSLDGAQSDHAHAPAPRIFADDDPAAYLHARCEQVLARESAYTPRWTQKDVRAVLQVLIRGVFEASK